MEIRIKIGNEEFDDLKKRSEAAGLPSVAAFSRSLLFPQYTYAEKWANIIKYINSPNAKDPFYVRDALPNPPALLGRWLYEARESLGIESAGKDRVGINLWRKK